MRIGPTEPSAPESPHANEAEWYDRHYQTEFAEAPWHRFALRDLSAQVAATSLILELGCGQGHLLRNLAAKSIIPAGNLFGLDQSGTAVAIARRHLPNANIEVGDVYQLRHATAKFDICVMLEVIEHLTHPEKALAEVHRVLKPHGHLYLSFPNYLHLPWLVIRILAEMTGHPNWICLQPIDRLYAVPWLKNLLLANGFEFVRASGSIYGPPVFYRWEHDWMSKALNSAGLWWLSFHPVMIFRRRDG